jgi:hypothetical protein
LRYKFESKGLDFGGEGGDGDEAGGHFCDMEGTAVKSAAGPV